MRKEQESFPESNGDDVDGDDGDNDGDACNSVLFEREETTELCKNM